MLQQVVERQRGDFSDQWEHVERTHLIRSAENYIVVLDLQSRLDWETLPSLDKEIKEYPTEKSEKHHDIISQIALDESRPCEGFTTEVLHHYRRLLGEALAMCLAQQHLAAEKLLKGAQEYFVARNAEISRDWYLRATARATGIFVVLGICLWMAREFATVSLGDTAFWLALSASAGAVGALFSVIVRSGELHFDASAGKKLHNLEGYSRVVAGAIAATMAVMAVRSNIILGALTIGGDVKLISMLAALVFGTSERYVTSIISRFDESRTGADKDLDEVRGGSDSLNKKRKEA